MMPTEFYAYNSGAFSTATGAGADLRFAAAANPEQVLKLIEAIRELQAELRGAECNNGDLWLVNEELKRSQHP